jgi:restriction endonuclease S subunit
MQNCNDVVHEEIDIEFLCYYFNSINMMKYARDQVTRPKLNKSSLNNIPIRYPDVDTQRNIVRSLNYLLGIVEVKKLQIRQLHDRNADLLINESISFKQRLQQFNNLENQILQSVLTR